MPFKDPQIAVGPGLSARACQAVFPLIWRLQYSSPDVQFATKPIARPKQITVPTRHGAVRTLIYSLTAGDLGVAELPLTLILTAEYATLRHEMNALADDLRAKGVPGHPAPVRRRRPRLHPRQARRGRPGRHHHDRRPVRKAKDGPEQNRK